jgi:hypothetical protein
MIIHATPMVGKTSLLQLLGYHILHQEPDLEPVYLIWENREKSKNFLHAEFLQEHKLEWQKKNMKVRPRNPNAQQVYLIDEAEGSYEDEGFWCMLKDCRNTKTQPLFVLVCVYGLAAGISYQRDSDIVSQALRMYYLQQIELRSSSALDPCLLFRKNEVDLAVKKFAFTMAINLRKESANIFIRLLMAIRAWSGCS